MESNINISMLDSLSLDELARLPAAVLFDLQEAITAEMDAAKAHTRTFAGVLTKRYHERDRDTRLAAAKPSGIIRFEDEGLTVAADAPKQVHWDRDKLEAALRKLEPQIAERYAKRTLVVEERRFAEAPAGVKSLLEPARSVAVGKPSYHLAPRVSEQEAA